MIVRTPKHSLPFLLALLSVACSGGSVSVGVSDFPLIPLPAITEPMTSNGVISDLSSVTVNAVRYRTDSTGVTLNGRAASLDDLQLGQYVQVEGLIEANGVRGSASHINHDADIVGPIDAIDTMLGQLVVMGQIVSTSTQTVFAPDIDPADLTGLSVGAIVQVSGFLRADGQLAATSISNDPGAAQVQLIGRVSGLDLANLLFNVNGLVVDYGNVTIVELAGGEPSNGSILVARGNLVNGILAATELTERHRHGIRERRERAHTEGYVTRFNSPADFDVNDHRITTDSNTRFSNGLASDLKLNARVRVEGRIANDRSTITASKVEFRHPPNATTTVTYDVSGFSEISVSSVFDVTVEQDPMYSVAVTIDEDLSDKLDVRVSGDTLEIGLLPGNNDVETIEAVVKLPLLNHIALNGVVRASLAGFNQPRLSASVGGVSLLQGDSVAIGHLDANLFGVSRLNFGSINPLGTADIDVSGVSTATLNMGVGSTLTGSVTGTSLLLYYGTNVTLDVPVGPSSVVRRLGETRP